VVLVGCATGRSQPWQRDRRRRGGRTRFIWGMRSSLLDPLNDQRDREAQAENATVNTSTEDKIRELAALLEQARPMPLMRNRVRIGNREAEALIAAIQQTRSGGSEDAVPASTDSIRDALHQAFPVPLTDQVRIAPTEARALAHALLVAAGLTT
jgi:hypothetical protein